MTAHVTSGRSIPHVSPRHKSRLCWCLTSALVILLTIIECSAATYHPEYQNTNMYHNSYPYSNPSNEVYREEVRQQSYSQAHAQTQAAQSSSGGSHYESPQVVYQVQEQHPYAQQQHQQYPSPYQVIEDSFHPPKVLLKHMSMALRVTSEWNRRLKTGVSRLQFWKPRQENKNRSIKKDATTQSSLPVHVHPTRSWHPPIPDPEPNQNTGEETLTLFHAKKPRVAPPTSGELSPKGVARWGPELLPYLEHVTGVLGISNGAIELAMALLYLDRASSMETQRSNGIPACPFCTSRTVHRLIVASLLVACQANQGWTEAQLLDHIKDLQTSLGIPQIQLQQMVEWMKGALGDEGMAITLAEMKVWASRWESVFPSDRKATAKPVAATARPETPAVSTTQNQPQSSSGSSSHNPMVPTPAFYRR